MSRHYDRRRRIYVDNHHGLFRTEVVEVVGGGWIVLIDGIQHGGKRDRSGAGDLVFATFDDAVVYARPLGPGR